LIRNPSLERRKSILRLMTAVTRDDQSISDARLLVFQTLSIRD